MADQTNVSYENQKIIPTDLEREMKKSFMDYSMSVITARSLPDVRDGLKPVHRRILFTMWEANLTPDKPHRKCAAAVGDVLGKYHPHGDASVYDALVRMAQYFSLRYMLIDGHGNFGNVDGDAPAAYRYTEARMSKIAMEMLSDIEKDTVNFQPNYDNLHMEPTVLPSHFPNLLVNGSSGIAVGMATNIPPHNLREVIGAAVCVLDNPEATLDDLMEHMHGPDFPTYGFIYGRAGIRAAYATGRGRVRVRAKADIEEHKGKMRIVVTELPYMVNKKDLVIHISNLVRDKSIEGISAMRDETGRDGMKIVMELKRDANAQVVLNQLYKMSALQSTFAINSNALVNGQPMTLPLRSMLDHYLDHQREIVIRATKYDLKKALDRVHILEGLKIACDNIDEVIKIIRTSYDDAKQQLMIRFNLSDIQGQSIIEMRLGRLQGLEVEKLQNEINDLHTKITDYNDILARPERVTQIIRDRLTAISDKFGDNRKTIILEDEDEIDMEDLIEKEDCVYTITHLGYIKRQPKTAYRVQRRGGKGISAQTIREEDFVVELFVASTHDDILFFTNKGRMFKKRGYCVPEAGRTAKGTNVINLFPLEEGEKITATIPVSDNDEFAFLFLVTKNGTVKRVDMQKFARAGRKSGLRAITLEEGNDLICVRKTDGKQDMIIATRNGMAICFPETDVRETGRGAMGVRGIRLKEDDYVIGAARAKLDGSLLTVTENGFGKRTAIEEYRRGGEAQHRGGKGMKNQNISDKTGKIADIKVVSDNDDIMIISDDGTIIRMAAATVNTYSRTAQGIILMRMSEGAKVISVARTIKEEETEIVEGEEAAVVPDVTQEIAAEIVPEIAPKIEVASDAEVEIFVDNSDETETE